MSIASHYLISVIFLIMVGLTIKQSFVFGAIGTLPDLDYIIGWHRGTFHTLFILLAIITFLFLITTLYGIKSKQRRKITSIGIALFILHLTADIITSGVAFFYPLSTKTFQFSLQSGLAGKTLQPTINVIFQTSTLSDITPHARILPAAIFEPFALVLVVGLGLVIIIRRLQ